MGRIAKPELFEYEYRDAEYEYDVVVPRKIGGTYAAVRSSRAESCRVSTKTPDCML
jgi:hypothetical protein